MAIRLSKYNSQGFTLIEMIVTVMVAGILMAIATPSLLSLNKPLRDGSLQFKSQLSLIRSKAISSSKAYRIRPKFTTTAELNANSDGKARNFVVEYADNCQMLENNATTPVVVRWQMASQFDLDLPPNIGIPTAATTLPTIGAVTTSATSSELDWTGGKVVCFDNRGILADTTTKIALRDFQGFNKAKLSAFELTKVGGADIYTYTDALTTIAPSSQGNPEF